MRLAEHLLLFCNMFYKFNNTGIQILDSIIYHMTLKLQSNLGYPNADYPKLLGYSKAMDSPEFFLYYLLQ